VGYLCSFVCLLIRSMYLMDSEVGSHVDFQLQSRLNSFAKNRYGLCGCSVSLFCVWMDGWMDGYFIGAFLYRERN
jgi:hypothetical protein